MQQPEQPKLYDIYGVEYTFPWYLQSWFMYCVIGIVVLFIGYFVYRWYSTRKKLELPYHQQILSQLDVLQEADWSKNHKQFYIALTALLKQYLQHRFTKQFVGTTDSECLELLRSDKFIPEWLVERFKNLIDGIMFVKFANAQAAQERMQKDLDSVRSIISATKLK